MVQNTLLVIDLQIYLAFQPFLKSFTTPTGNDRIVAWKLKGLYE